MIVSQERKVLFVHVQKTGGITLEHVLLEGLPGAEKATGLPRRKHAWLSDALHEHPDWADYWTFGFVRNPWARMWSWYSMIQRRGESAEAGDERVALRTSRNAFWTGVLTEIPDFEAFVMQGPDRFARLREPQIDYLRTPDKEADFIGRTERLDQDLGELCATLGIPAPATVPHQNASPKADYRTRFTPAMRERVAEVFAPDIRLFGYTFEG